MNEDKEDVLGFTILGTGSALPLRAVSNDELSKFLDTSDEWIYSRTGIKNRHVCSSETLDDIAVTACQRALENAGTSIDSIDLIVCSTTTGDHLVPAEACAIAECLGARCPAFDVSAACAGFVYALDVADGYIARNRAHRVLVVAAEEMSRALDWNDRATCVLFGDGAGAAVIEAGGETPLAAHITCAADVETLNVPGITGTSPFKQFEQRQNVLSMNGRRVFKFGVNAICDSIDRLCADANISADNIDHFIFHQANERILAQAVKRLGIDDARVVRTLEQTGNISSACIPFALDMLNRQGALKQGDLIALVGFGAGLDIGGYLLRW